MDSPKLRLLKARLAWHQRLYARAHAEWQKWKLTGDTAHYWHDEHERKGDHHAAQVNQRQIEKARAELHRLIGKLGKEAKEIDRYHKAIAALAPKPSPVQGWEAWLARVHPELKSGIRHVTALILATYPTLQITATTGGSHSTASYHYLGRAVDLAYPMTESGIAGMDNVGDWIQLHLKALLTEGIHNPSLSVKYGQLVSPSYWSEQTFSAHRNHLHIAV